MTEETNKSRFEAFAQHQRNAADEASKAIDALFPPEFKEHGKKAVSESVEGFRVLMNGLLDEINSELKKDDNGDDAAPKTKVKVNVS